MKKIKDYIWHIALLAAFIVNIVQVCIEGATLTNNILAWVMAIMLVPNIIYLMVRLTQANATLKKSITPKFRVGQKVYCYDFLNVEKREVTIKAIRYDGFKIEYEIENFELVSEDMLEAEI